MADKPKGDGSWISTSGGGGVAHEGEHDDDCSGLHTSNGYCVPTEASRQRGEREVARINRNAHFIRSLLKHHALDVAGACRGQPLDDDEAAELAERLDKEIAALPQRFRAQVTKAGEDIRASVSTGNRVAAWRRADETAVEVGAQLSDSSWSPPKDPSPEDLIADIPR